MAKVQKYNEVKLKGTKKTNQNKSTSSSIKSVKNEKIQILKKEITGIFIVAFAIFLIVVTNMESQTGIIGKTINMFTHSAFGRGSNVLPYVILIIGIMRLLNIVITNDTNQIIAILGFFICYIMYSALTDMAVYTILIGKTSFIEIINTAKDLGMQNSGGGILGNILTFICVKLVGKNGTIIILGTMIFTFIILLTNQSIIGGVTIVFDFIKKIINSIYNFIFVEVEEDEDNNKKQKKIKSNKNDHSKNVAQDENIKIFDYTNSQADKTKSSNEITQLKIEDLNNKGNLKNELNAGNNLTEQSTNQTDNKTKNEDIAANEKNGKVKDNKFKSKEITDDIINISGSIKSKYELPSSTLLNQSPAHIKGDKADLRKEAEKLIETLNNFNIKCNILQINKGPTITRYELQPAPGIKVSRITSLTNDLAMALATSEIRMEAPIPGKSAIGIEVPNKVKTSVFLRNIIESKEYKSAETNIPFALGKDITGKNIVASIEKMPHLLIAGATGSGKSVCINSLIMSILYRARPDEVKLILIDPKVVELSVYNGIPHLLIPVVTDPRKAANALNWAVSEMTGRYKIFAKNSVRDIFSYNEKMSLTLFFANILYLPVISETAQFNALAALRGSVTTGINK